MKIVNTYIFEIHPLIYIFSFRKMKNVVWIFLIYTLVFNLFNVTYCVTNKEELNANLKLSNSSTHGTPHVSILSIIN